MDQEQIHVCTRAPDLLNALKDLIVGSFDRARGAEDLRRRKDLFTGETALAQCFTDFTFVTVELCRVDMSVAHFQGLQA